MIGAKHDAGKRRWTLIPLGPLRAVVDVLEFGASRYGAGNWQHVENAQQRYLDALWRHLTAYTSGEKDDLDSLQPHLAHVVCCALFLIWFEGRK